MSPTLIPVPQSPPLIPEAGTASMAPAQGFPEAETVSGESADFSSLFVGESEARPESQAAVPVAAGAIALSAKPKPTSLDGEDASPASAAGLAGDLLSPLSFPLSLTTGEVSPPLRNLLAASFAFASATEASTAGAGETHSAAVDAGDPLLGSPKISIAGLEAVMAEGGLTRQVSAAESLVVDPSLGFPSSVAAGGEGGSLADKDAVESAESVEIQFPSAIADGILGHESLTLPEKVVAAQPTVGDPQALKAVDSEVPESVEREPLGPATGPLLEKLPQARGREVALGEGSVGEVRKKGRLPGERSLDLLQESVSAAMAVNPAPAAGMMAAQDTRSELHLSPQHAVQPLISPTSDGMAPALEKAQQRSQAGEDAFEVRLEEESSAGAPGKPGVLRPANRPGLVNLTTQPGTVGPPQRTPASTASGSQQSVEPGQNETVSRPPVSNRNTPWNAELTQAAEALTGRREAGRVTATGSEADVHAEAWPGGQPWQPQSGSLPARGSEQQAASIQQEVDRILRSPEADSGLRAFQGPARQLQVRVGEGAGAVALNLQGGPEDVRISVRTQDGAAAVALRAGLSELADRFAAQGIRAVLRVPESGALGGDRGGEANTRAQGGREDSFDDGRRGGRSRQQLYELWVESGL